ncbi:uncharacterized protein LOC125372731 [Haliotis rufescens]|uniref:uncharacterized protein LOC125372731 n=1 Tax=Haliotis rufescens TaxID=6454 RepID=UPI00201F8FE9|nr:uncharacterized protein LOC125372731 [Haliotis rufescens]
MAEEEIVAELKDQNVTSVKRFTVKKQDGKIVPSNTYLFTFALSTVPKSIKAGYFNIGVEVYIPSPLRCYTCQKFGHGSKSCRYSHRCHRCSEDHQDSDCTKDPKCANCSGDHLSSSKSCPEWQIQTKILKLKYETNIPFHEAKQQILSQTPAKLSTSISYSAAVSNKPKTVSISCQTDLTWVTSDQPVNTDTTRSQSLTLATSSSQTATQSQAEVDQAAVDIAVPVETSQKQRKRLNRKKQSSQSSSPLEVPVTVEVHNSFDPLEMEVTPSSEHRNRSPSSSRGRERSPIEPP